MTKEEWIEKAAEQFCHNGIMYKDDGLISKSAGKAMAEEALKNNPDALDEDPVKYAKGDLSNWIENVFGDEKEGD